MRQPGTLSGDQSIYSGTRLIGHMRSSAGGVTAFRADGTVIGSYPSRKAATIAISALSAGPEAGGVLTP